MGIKNLFGIALFDWDGFNYSFYRARLFRDEKERDAVYNVLCNFPYYKRGDGDLRKFESEIE
jgi:hypothetical protein